MSDQPPTAEERPACPANALCVMDPGHEGDCSPWTPETLQALAALTASTKAAFLEIGAAWAKFGRELLKARARTQRDYTLCPDPEPSPDGQTDKPGVNDLQPCYGCRVQPGENHQAGCDWARCPDCGEQLIFHECEWWEDDEPDRPSTWHGLDPKAEVARAMGWWTTAVGIEGPVEDSMAVLLAAARDLIGWNRETQRYNFPDHPIPAPEYTY